VLLNAFTANDRRGIEVEQTIDTHRGPRHYLVKLEPMLDVSEKYMGVVVLLNDLTARREAEDRLHARSEEISTLYDVTAIVTAPAALETVLEQALVRVLASVKGLGGSIRLLDEDSGQLRQVAGQQKGHIQQPGPACDVLALWVATHEAPLVLDDMQTDPRVPPAAASPHTFVAVPMRAGGRLQGVLSVFRAQGQRFDAPEVSLLVTVADGMGLAVENGRKSRQEAVVQERERLSRELHDSVTQSLYSLTLFGEWTAGLLAQGETDQAHEKVTRISEIARQALREMRLMVYELRSSELEGHGLHGALVRRLTAVEERAGVRTVLRYDPDLQFAPSVEDELYQIVQEALNNALKHSRAQMVTVEAAAYGPAARVTICDDGTGFDPQAAAHSGGMGLASMHTRAARLGAKLIIDSSPGHGCLIRVEMPCAV
jgi:signal transduction histidine kinase